MSPSKSSRGFALDRCTLPLSTNGDVGAYLAATGAGMHMSEAQVPLEFVDEDETAPDLKSECCHNQYYTQPIGRWKQYYLSFSVKI